MTTTTTEVLTDWERVTCSRCGGSGQYSYCQMHGSVCFKCGGAKRVLTKRAQVALAWLRSKRATRVADLQVGMLIKVEGTPGISATKNCVLREITQSKSSCIAGNVQRFYIDLVFDHITLGVFNDSTVEVIPSTEAERVAQVRDAIAYQNTLTKTGKPRVKALSEQKAGR